IVLIPPSAGRGKMFEQRFLMATESFYVIEAALFLQGNSVTEYLNRVERRMREEKDRCDAYLDPCSAQPLMRKSEEVLISQKLGLFQDELGTLVEENRYEDIVRMYKLCERVQGGLD
ncbi:hypothetical protein PMAYCL1PPCAC_20633, partial [Pristionchus mayeri]